MKRTISILVISLASLATAFSQTQPPLIGMGDSLTEGVQSFNASTVSQPNDFLVLIAQQMGVPFAQPGIKSNSLGIVNSTVGRSRLSPTTVPADLGVSGAKTEDVLITVAATPAKTETDLVLPPYYGLSQIQIVEQIKPKVIFCWIGANDLINYVLDWNQLAAPTGITPIDQFTSQYQELISRLYATGAQVIVGNIPDLTKIGYLFDANDLVKFLGSSYNLPAGAKTTLPAVMMLKLGQSVDLSDPNYALPPSRITFIQQQIDAYNAVIQSAAHPLAIPVFDSYTFLDHLSVSPVIINGIPITNHFNGGAFSLDGVHPSDSGYGIFANAFIQSANVGYPNLKIPSLTNSQLVSIFDVDPFIDMNGNGVVPGRPGTGLLETIMPIYGFSGDKTDGTPGKTAGGPKTVDLNLFKTTYCSVTGCDPTATWTRADVMNAVDRIAGMHHN